MKLNKLTGMILMLLLLSVMHLQLSSKLAMATHEIIRVPDDYPTIQAAIDAADPGGTISVKTGTYHEHVTLNKPLTLMADGNDTIIDGSGLGHTVHITANNVTLIGFTIKGSNEPWTGLYITSALNTIRRNKILNNYYGVNMRDSGPNVFRSNNLTDNHYNFRIWGLYLGHFAQDIDTSNTVNGKPIYYWVNQHERQVPTDAGYVAIVNSSNIVVEDLTLTNNEQGILLAHSRSCLIRNITASNNAWGVHVLSSHDNVINQNAITANEYGIFVDTSNNNTITNNNITDNKWKGVILSMSPLLSSTSHNNIIGENTIDDNYYGIYLDTSDNNTITENRIANNRLQGLSLWSSSENIFCGNTIIGNQEGIWLSDSGGNVFHCNNVVNNTIPVNTDRSPSPASVWDDGYPFGGNYWSDYNGVDEKSGPNQNENGSDWIGDTPYIIDEENQDNYPLMDTYLPKTQNIQVAYRKLLGNYNALLSDFNSLNSTYYELSHSHDNLLADYNDLQAEIDALKMSYDLLNLSYNELESEQEATISEFNNIRNLMYIFLTTAIILMATTVYFAKARRNPKNL